MRTIFYLLREAWANIWTNRTTTVVAIFTTAFPRVRRHLSAPLREPPCRRRLAAGRHQDHGVSGRSGRRINRRRPRTTAARRPRRRRPAFISKEQALGEFRAQFPSDSHLLEGLGQNPLPASFVVTLSPPFRSPDAVKRWAERTAVLARVEKLTIIRTGSMLCPRSSGPLSWSPSGLDSSCRRGRDDHRQHDQAHVVCRRRTRHFAADRRHQAFIRIPYLLEGAVLGGWEAPAHCSCSRHCTNCFGIKCGRRDGCGPRAAHHVFPLSICLLLVGVGIVLGFAGSFVSLRRFDEARV